MPKKKKWNDYMWIVSTIYLVLGFFNILFAWLGLICMFVPIGMAVIGGNKGFCHNYCGRGQLFERLGKGCKLSCNRKTPKWMKSKGFRTIFLVFFFAMFGVMLFGTYLVFAGADLKQAVTLLWTFKVPWHFAYHGTVFAPWVAQFAFGLYGVMLTSTIIGLVVMVLFKPKTWCTFCPMGIMTQMICKAKNKELIK